MVNLATFDVALVHVLANAEALDDLRFPSYVVSGRLAATEAIGFVAPAKSQLAVEELLAALDRTDPRALVLDLSDAYSGYRLSGEWEFVYASLCELPVPEHGVLTQGLFGHLAAKITRSDGALNVFVGSVVGHYLRQRVRSVCEAFDLELAEQEDAVGVEALTR